MNTALRGRFNECDRAPYDIVGIDLGVPLNPVAVTPRGGLTVNPGFYAGHEALFSIYVGWDTLAHVITETLVAAKKPAKKKTADPSQRFEPGRLDSLFVVLDAIAWMENPTAGAIAQYAAIDRGSVGKLLKNAKKIGLVETLGEDYILNRPYPYKGSLEAKQTVVRDALFRLPLLTSVRQFLGLGNNLPAALRKAATVNGVNPYSEPDLMPLVDWARSLSALDPNMVIEDLLNKGEEAKAERHKVHAAQRVAFLSHSSRDKPFIRQLAADLTANGISVWLDEQRIRVGDSIPERVAQGLAESDVFLVAISQNSVDSSWVRKELDRALVKEIESRKTEVLLNRTGIPGELRV